MDKIYHWIGFAVVWLGAAAALGFVGYWLLIIAIGIKWRIEMSSWYNYHIRRKAFDSKLIIEKYRIDAIRCVRKNKKWLLLYRLRNIRKAKAK